MYFWSYIYYLSKYYELLDTFLLILKVYKTSQTQLKFVVQCHSFIVANMRNSNAGLSHTMITAQLVLFAGKAALLLARLPPCNCGANGVLLAGRCSVTAADCASHQHPHPCHHVLLLLSLLHWARAQLEAPHHQCTDCAVYVQVMTHSSLVLWLRLQVLATRKSF